ncbi:MAG: serine/threonine-protein kinase [Planctomycetota bacterium]
MTACPHCHANLAETARFCQACGREVEVGANANPPPTAALEATSAWEPDATPSAPGRAAAPAENGLPTPGQVLLGRYHIQSLLGQGGMGSVFRAHDQTLGQDVALKFVDAKLAGTPTAIATLLNEVRTARRVSHPHVCRVHDIGEVNGLTFVSMEYVDGEDLASLLRRIGRLPGDKAAQIATQLCAGLHAAHEQGVLHRDLKPANVMVDGDGNARITDFGIAAATDSLSADESTSGTPAYMAPELFTGGAASIQSDLYSLGLVLYEVYTGRQLYRASSMTELLRAHRRPILPPSGLVADIEPAAEQAILRCLEREPEGRPQSALAVLAAMPGGDPLGEALASGQTPSPELVAAAGGSGSIPPRLVAALLVMIAVGLALLFALEGQVKLLARTNLPHSTEVLADRAKTTLESLGYRTLGAHRSYGFTLDRPKLDQVNALERREADWRGLLSQTRPPLIEFWYRQTPSWRWLQPANIKGRVDWHDPVPGTPGEVLLKLDGDGNLRELRAVPDQDAQWDSLATTAEPPTAALLAAIGLDPTQLESIAPTEIPPEFADRRLAWQGTAPDEAVRVEVQAAFLGQRPVSLRLHESPLAAPTAGEAGPAKPGTRSWRFLARVGLVLGAGILAWDALRRRRSDGRGALRLALITFGAVVAFTVLAGDGAAHFSGLGNLLVKGMTHGLVIAVELGVYYFALEQHVRRSWPQSLISWSRLLAGRWRDPLVGHHVLAGLAISLAITLMGVLKILVPRWLGEAEPPPMLIHLSGLDVLSGPWSSAGVFLEIAIDAARQGMMFFTALVLLKLVLRKPWLAATANTVIWTLVWNAHPFAAGFPWITSPTLCSAAMAGTITFLAIRFGLLPLLVGNITFTVLTTFPLQLGEGVWYSGATALPLLALLLGAIYGARTAVHRPT